MKFTIKYGNIETLGRSLFGIWRRNFAKSIIPCLSMLCILIVITAGCSYYNTKSTISDQKELIQPASPVDAEKDNNQSILDIPSFKPLKQSFIEYDFIIKEEGGDMESISFLAEGEYDLNQDGKADHISIQTIGDDGRDKEVETYIIVNDLKQEFSMDYTSDGEVRLVDLDKKDKFIEAAIFDEGPSGDPHYSFYRYDGKKLYKIGEIDSGALIDGEGKLISSFHITRYFTPRFFSAWFEIENNTFVQKSNDINRYLGNRYKFDGDEAYFIPCDSMPEAFSPTWGETTHLKVSELEVIDVYFLSDEDRILNFFFVELPDGKKGMLYFWIGD